jgi:hypothetical protein
LCQSYHNQQQQSAITTNANGDWHPYLVAHTGGSHIDSSIQSRDSSTQSSDSSPTSVYTPPMVSPYATQVNGKNRKVENEREKRK